MRTYIVTLLLAVITAFPTVVLWGAVGHRLSAFIVSMILAGVLLVSAFGLATWKGRWAGSRGASLRGWWALVGTALVMLVVPPLLGKDVIAESLGEHGTWWLGSSADSAPAFIGNGMNGVAQLLGYSATTATEAEAAAGVEGAEETLAENDATQPASSEGSGVAAPVPLAVVPEPVGEEVPIDEVPTAIAPVGELVAEPSAADPSLTPTEPTTLPSADPAAVTQTEPLEEGEAPTEPAQAEPTSMDPATLTPAEIAATIAANQPPEPADPGTPATPLEVTQPSPGPAVEVVSVVIPERVGGASLVPQVEAAVVGGTSVWPSSATPHPLAVSLDASSFETLRAGICALRGVDRLRVAHDWIALNIAPVAAPRQSSELPSAEQRAAWASGAFSSREAGSTGFAALFSELTCDADALIVSGGDAAFHRGTGAAAYWNAVQLDGSWLIVDTFQAAGCTPGPGCATPYSSSFFLAPARATIRTRIPSQASFAPYGGDVDIIALLSGPALGPEFFAAGLALQSVSLDEHFEVAVANPSARNIRVALWDSGAAMSVTCPRADVGAQTSFVCPPAGPAGGRARLLGQAQDGWAWVELAAWEIR